MDSQVEPPFVEKELAYWFMDTAKPMFYEIMVSSVLACFSDLVVVGIKVELGLKNGKMIITTETSSNNVKKFSGGFQRKKMVKRVLCQPVKEEITHGGSNNDKLPNNN